GNLSFYDSSGRDEYNFQKPYSDKTAETIDSEVKLMIDQAYAKTRDILEKNKDKLSKLAESLLQKEVIFKEDLEEIFGRRPFDKAELASDAKASTITTNSEINQEITESSDTNDIQPDNTAEPKA